MSTFAPATRAATKTRVALCGPAGSGKTWTGLSIATALADKVAVIDTERGSASKYAGINGWEFDTVAPHTFSPASLTELLGIASGEGYGAVLIDSWSHYWSGTDGMQEQADRRAKGGNSFSGWKEARPDERRMIDAITAYPGHVVVTMRSKTQYVIEQVERNGRTTNVPRKIGLKPDQREGVEYEFDIVGDLDLDNVLTVSKSRIPALTNAVIAQPDKEFAEQIRTWLEEGEQLPTPAEYRTRALASGMSFEELGSLYREVERAGQLGSPMVDEDGNPTTLGELISAVGRRVKP